MSDTVPNDYDAADGWAHDHACHQCAHCNRLFHGACRYDGPFVNKHGEVTEKWRGTDTDNAPFFCESCWEELETNRKAAENAAITEWSE